MRSANDYAPYAYKEIVERDDEGKDSLPEFLFDISADEIVEWTDKSPAQHPSYEQRKPLIPAELTDGNVSHSIQTDLYALFATAGYLAAKFGREVEIDADSEKYKDKFSRTLTAFEFTDGWQRLKKRADTLYLSIAAKMNISPDAPLSISMKVVPAQAKRFH